MASHVWSVCNTKLFFILGIYISNFISSKGIIIIIHAAGFPSIQLHRVKQEEGKKIFSNEWFHEKQDDYGGWFVCSLMKN